MARTPESQSDTTSPAAASRPPSSVTADGYSRPLRRTPLAVLLDGRRWRHAARWVGMLIFIAGVALLAYVFNQALNGFQSFSNPDYLTKSLDKLPANDAAAKSFRLVMLYGNEFLRVLYLLLLGYLASAVATKGIQFFSASEAVIDEAVAAGLDD